MTASQSPQSLTVFVKGLVLQAQIGLHAHERGRRQPLRLDVDLTLDPRAARVLAQTVDYSLIVQEAAALADRGHIELVERFAQLLAERCLAFPGVRRVRVRLEKPQALDAAEAAGVELVLSRPEAASDRSLADADLR
jgi:dihydroneopterin aldolase